ncbi:hypothetical protein BDW22DRAFT_1361102 [Trametopsis cervina]|nr:hypothetical protein BDW22DRAFT_1361102 [Trametopsis cervina]
MGKTTEFYCPICWDWLPTSRSQALTCGHVLCDTCLEVLKQRNARFIECPTCRTKINHNGVHRLYLSCRVRPRKKIQAADPHSSHAHSVDLDIPSSSRAGTPAFTEPAESSSDEADVDAPKPAYTGLVQLAAARATEGIHPLKQQSPIRTISVEGVGEEITKVVNEMPHQEGDHVELLLTALADFMTYTAGPIFDEVLRLRRLTLDKETKNMSHRQTINDLESDLRIARKRAQDVEVERQKQLNDAYAKVKSTVLERDALLKKEASYDQHLKSVIEKTKTLEAANQTRAKREKSLKERIGELQSELDVAKAQLLAKRDDTEEPPTWVSDNVFNGDHENSHPESQVRDDMTRDTPSPPPFEVPTRSAPTLPYTDVASASRPSLTQLFQPRFGSDWTLKPKSTAKRKLETQGSSSTLGTFFPIKRDSSGRVVGNVQVGPRVKLNKYN